jgi:hypothetical protein
VKNLRGVWIGRDDESIVCPLAVATGSDESGAFEISEMA